MTDEIMGGHAGGDVGCVFGIFLAPLKDLRFRSLGERVEVDVRKGTGIQEEFGDDIAESQQHGQFELGDNLHTLRLQGEEQQSCAVLDMFPTCY